MLPLIWNGELTLPIALVQKVISKPFESTLPVVVVMLMILSGAVSLIATATSGAGLNGYFRRIFVTSWFSVVFRKAR